MWDYFDLNNRALRGRETDFRGKKKPISHPVKFSLIRQILIYAGIFIGVLFSTIVIQLGSREDVNITITGSKLVLSAIIALIFIPIEYEKLRLSPELPFIVQFGVFVQNGVFWHVIIVSLSKIL